MFLFFRRSPNNLFIRNIDNDLDLSKSLTLPIALLQALRCGIDRLIPNFHKVKSSVFTWRNHRTNSVSGGRLVYASFVICSVAVQGTDFIVDLSQKFRNNRSVVATIGGQFRYDDLLSFGVHGNMKFTPSPMLTPSVFANLPLALAVNFKPRAVDNNVQRTVLTSNFNGNVQGFRTFAQRRIVGNTCVSHA